MANLRASMNGDSYVVDAVMQNESDLVTAAMAEIGSLYTTQLVAIAISIV